MQTCVIFCIGRVKVLVSKLTRKTISGESLATAGYTHWGQFAPVVRPGKDCGVFSNYTTHKYGLGEFVCSDNLPYICEEETEVKEKSIPTPDQVNPPFDGYEFIAPLGYYKHHHERVIWQEAVDVCAREGGHLLILNSDEERRAVTSLVHRGYDPYFAIWTGVHDQYRETYYVTIFSKY